MTTIYNPADKGFDERLAVIDRCQIALLREIVGQFGAGRLFLKGGMAMRVVFGGMRLTKDIDFDRDPSQSLDSAKGGLRRALVRAAANAGIRQAQSEITKASATTVRARLAGRSVTGADLRFEVEVSGRGLPAPRFRRTEIVVPPPAYGMAPFVIESYVSDMLAAMKIAALMSEARNVPRDIHDLNDLLIAGANPVEILAQRPKSAVRRLGAQAREKVSGITFALARDELLPYLPPDARERIDESEWAAMIQRVATAIEHWASKAWQSAAETVPTRTTVSALKKTPSRPPRRKS